MAAVGPVAVAGIATTADAYGRLRYYRALATFVAGGPVAAVMADLEAAIARSLAPVNEYRLRALVNLRARRDREAAMTDLARCVALLTPAEAARLRTDPLLAELHGDPRFAALFAPR